ncbi:peptidoglycan-binding protein [Streptomyces sp. WMMB303]|uniref:peptidoglycan-binding domain-containing protein n=1 Tax=Streptomyces sp. WMMB303 TaxID=3034154 RepID=UPI0023ECAD51|nr:peptidoglycan-binding protein [Streptomyces sp. WMMB303]MDF4252601.1 peptidoglycan-binding protein [Streptomyces sp. WMMB303]
MSQRLVRLLTLFVTLAGTGCSADGSDASPKEKASPRSPSVAGGHVYVRGGGTVTDDWDDEGLLGENLPDRSDLAAMWQTVLWADGYLKRSSIDCHYSKATRRATRAWQSNHALPADGIVGPRSFGRATERLVRRGGMTVFEGERHDVPFKLAHDGKYLVEDSGTYKPLRRDRPTLRVCDSARE